MSVTQKDYDYEAVVQFTNTGGPLDQALSKLQEDLVKLRTKINECEPLYHGVGQSSSIYATYQNLYNKIGTENGGGMWSNANNSRTLINLMHENAVNDQTKDAGGE